MHNLIGLLFNFITFFLSVLCLMNKNLFYLILSDYLDSTIASPVSELITTLLPDITLAVAEAYPFRTSRQYLELWRSNMIRNDSDHALKFDEPRGIAWVKNVHTSDRVFVFSTRDVRVVKAYYLIYRLLNSDILATRDHVLQSNQDAINEFALQTTPEAQVERNLTQQPGAVEGGVGCRCVMM